MAPVLQVGKLRFREITSFAQGNEIGTWRSRDSTPACLLQPSDAAQTPQPPLRRILLPRSLLLKDRGGGGHTSTAHTRLTDIPWGPESEKGLERPGLLTPSSQFASSALDLTWVVSSQSTEVTELILLPPFLLLLLSSCLFSKAASARQASWGHTLAPANSLGGLQETQTRIMCNAFSGGDAHHSLSSRELRGNCPSHTTPVVGWAPPD